MKQPIQKKITDARKRELIRRIVRFRFLAIGGSMLPDSKKKGLLKDLQAFRQPFGGDMEDAMAYAALASRSQCKKD